MTSDEKESVWLVKFFDLPSSVASKDKLSNVLAATENLIEEYKRSWNIFLSERTEQIKKDSKKSKDVGQRTSSVLYSGANRGIGLSLVKQFQHKGIIFATARAPEKAEELNQLAKENKNIHVIKLDVTSKESSLRAAAEVAEVTDRVGILVVNAGVSQSYRPIEEIDEEDLDKHFKTNVYGAIYTFQAIYPFLKRSLRKEIAFISSVAGSVQGFFLLELGLTVLQRRHEPFY